MRVTYEDRTGFTEARLSEDPDDLARLARIIESAFGAEWLQKLNGLDQSYWDCSLRGISLTLHREHYLGVSLVAASAETDLGRANALVVEIGAYLSSLTD